MEKPPAHGASSRATAEPDRRARRWRLIGELSTFVVKVAIEAIRDLILIPVAVGAGVVGLLFHREQPDRSFREVLRAGRRFDEWLNLFGSRGPDRELGRGPRSEPASAGAGIDALLGRVEAVIVEQHHRGGITAQAKDAIDRALDALGNLAGAGRRRRETTNPDAREPRGEE